MTIRTAPLSPTRRRQPAMRSTAHSRAMRRSGTSPPTPPTSAVAAIISRLKTRPALSQAPGRSLTKRGFRPRKPHSIRSWVPAAPMAVARRCVSITASFSSTTPAKPQAQAKCSAHRTSPTGSGTMLPSSMTARPVWRQCMSMVSPKRWVMHRLPVTWRSRPVTSSSVIPIITPATIMAA